MSKESRNQREQLKQEYKKHYRKMREAKERLNRSQKTQNIAQALKRMDRTEFMASFDSFLFEVKSKVANAEARLDAALDSLREKEISSIQQHDPEAASDKIHAKETLKQLKTEMGMLHNEIEQQAAALDVDKTVGRSAKIYEESSNSTQPK